MLGRCGNPNNPAFHNYGARGIRVCERWLKFENFRDDMLPTWRPGLTLERTNNNGNYEPGNCYWATWKEQGRNKRNNRLIDTPWGRMTLADAAQRSGVSPATLAWRLKFVPPVQRQRSIHQQSALLRPRARDNETPRT